MVEVACAELGTLSTDFGSWRCSDLSFGDLNWEDLTMCRQIQDAA